MARGALTPMANVLGIDLGASYAKAVYLEHGSDTLRPVLNRAKEPVFRVCAVREDGAVRAISINEERRRALEAGLAVIENVKPLRGQNRGSEDVEIAVLREVLEQYRSQSRNYDLAQLDCVVLAHPVSHTAAAVAALKDIAVGAGLPGDRLDTIEEPVALGLFALREHRDFTGQMLVIDGGHYTSDFVLLSFDAGQPTVTATNYLNARLGAAELIHSLSRSAWVKAQLAAGERLPDPGPFQAYGPESGNAVVNRLACWAEMYLIHSQQFGFFGPRVPARLDLAMQLELEPLGPWASRVPFIDYYYDDVDAMAEELQLNYPNHMPQQAVRLRAENYRTTVRSFLRSLAPVVVAAILELPERLGTAVVAGGGLFLIPEAREGLEGILSAYGMAPPIGVREVYEGVVHSATELLCVAAGAALAGRNARERRDTLSDTLGILVYHEIEDALQLLDDEGLIAPDFDPISGVAALGVHSVAGGSAVIPLHHILARRNTPLPLEVTLPQYLIPLAEKATIRLTKVPHMSTADASVEPAGRASGGEVAQIEILEPVGTLLRLTLNVNRNDVWELRVTDGTGKVSLHFLPRRGSD